MATADRTLGLTEAAMALSASYPQTMRWLLTGQLEGRKEAGRWRIVATSVERLRARRTHESEVGALVATA